MCDSDPDKPNLPIGTDVRVTWDFIRQSGYFGVVVYEPRVGPLGWEIRVRPNGHQQALWVPHYRVSVASAVDLLGNITCS